MSAPVKYLSKNAYYFLFSPHLVGKSQSYQRQKRWQSCQTGLVRLLPDTNHHHDSDHFNEKHKGLLPVYLMIIIRFLFCGFSSLSATAPPNKKRAWSWPAYLEEEKAVAAPVKLFKEVLFLV